MAKKATFSVDGTCVIAVPPERAIVSGHVSLESQHRNEAMAQVMASVADLTRTFEQLRSAGVVTWFSIDQLTTSARTPETRDRVQLATRYGARVAFSVKFKDFDEMSRWVQAANRIEGVTVSRIEWALTSGRKSEVIREARQGAARDAHQRASDYASALGLSGVVVRSLSDNAPQFRAAHLDLALTRGLGEGGEGNDIQFWPEHVRVEVEVSAVFVARDGAGLSTQAAAATG